MFKPSFRNRSSDIQACQTFTFLFSNIGHKLTGSLILHIVARQRKVITSQGARHFGPHGIHVVRCNGSFRCAKTLQADEKQNIFEAK